MAYRYEDLEDQHTHRQFKDMVFRAFDSSNGVSILDRKHALKAVKGCFVASELVDWVAKYLHVGRPCAVKWCEAIFHRGIISHYNLEPDFKDDAGLYHYNVGSYSIAGRFTDFVVGPFRHCYDIREACFRNIGSSAGG